MEKFYKRSAIHNMAISQVETNFDLNEGIVIPSYIMEMCDIAEFEQIVVTKITGDNWKNRIKTFAISGNDNKVTVRGSLTHFFEIGDIICIISYTKLNSKQLAQYYSDEISILDLGFDPNPKKYNINNPVTYIEYFSGKNLATSISIDQAKSQRGGLKRIMLSNIITGLIINNTHPDCLHGSAELPKIIMDENKLDKYRKVKIGMMQNLLTGKIRLV